MMEMENGAWESGEWRVESGEWRVEDHLSKHGHINKY